MVDLKEKVKVIAIHNQKQLCLLEQRVTILSKSRSRLFCTEKTFMTAKPSIADVFPLRREATTGNTSAFPGHKSVHGESLSGD